METTTEIDAEAIHEYLMPADSHYGFSVDGDVKVFRQTDEGGWEPTTQFPGIMAEAIWEAVRDNSSPIANGIVVSD